MKRALLVAVAAAVLFHLGDTRVGAQATQPLNYFKTFFLTGDYAIAGVGLNSTGSGTINLSGVPEGADLAGAFLYWQVITRQDTPDAGGVGAMFRGNPLNSPEGILAKGLGPGTPTCGSSGGGTGSGGGSKRAFTYRMDVARYFQVDDTPGPNFGKLEVNGEHTVQLPISNNVEPVGASLVVLFRVSSEPPEPLRALVFYDGAYSMDQATYGMQLTMSGFYDGTPGPARLSLIGGNGQANKNEILRFNEPPLADDTPLATNAFRSFLGARWDNPTFDGDDGILTPPSDGGVTDEVTVSVSKENLGTFDCVTFAAVIYSTKVEDRDGDGLLDIWEESTTPLSDPNGMPLPNLNAMGADPDVRDVFAQIDYMQSGLVGGPLQKYKYGGVEKKEHSHLPGHEELKLVGDAFKGTGTEDRIRMHFDMGPNYPLGDPDPLNAKYNAEEYLVPRNVARGGQAIDERITLCTPGATDPEYVCQYSLSGESPFGNNAWPGTVGWKTGYRFLRDEIFSVTPPLPSPLPADKTPEDYCNTLVPSPPPDHPGQRYACDRRFPENRMNAFHYVLMVHHLGLPKSDLPCLSGTTPVAAGADDRCDASNTKNPEFHIPRTNGGIGDFPGADTLIALGAFPDLQGRPTGTPFQVAATIMHEFGHHFERRHGGEPSAPNCQPTYLSIMNYLYALRGLLDNAGRPHLDYSAAAGPMVRELRLDLDRNVDSPTYRLGWYAPLATSYLAGNASAAIRRCDGSFALPGENMVRIDARTSGVDIDWNADNNPATVATTQDVNYDGFIGERLPGSDDWSKLRLNQVGSRRNIGALYAVPGTNLIGVGPLSIGMTKGDLTKGDLTKGDLTKGDLTKGDLTKGDLTKGDLTKGDLGSGDLGKGDGGGGDLFRDGDPNTPDGEPDFEMVGDLNRTPPIGFEACVSGVLDCLPATPLHDVQTKWEFPNVVGLLSYTVYRVAGPELLNGQTWTHVATVPHVVGVGEYSATDPKNGDGTAQHPPLVGGQQYTYFAVGNYVGGRSDPGNLVTITAVNDPPVAVDDSNYATIMNTVLTVAAPGVLANDSDRDDPTVVLTPVLATPPSHGSVTLNPNGLGSFTYTPTPNYIGPDSFTYQVQSGTGTGAILSNLATVSITVNPPPIATFVGISNAPPPTGKTFNAGSAIPMAWGYAYTVNGPLVPSPVITQTVTVTGPAIPGGAVYTCTTTGPNPCTDPGSSYFKYSALTKQWSFNLQTKTSTGAKYGPGVYSVTITTTTPYFVGSVPGTPISITLK